VTPPPNGSPRRRPPTHPINRRRQRRRTQARRRRKLGVLVVLLLGIFAAVGGVGFGEAQSVNRGCDLGRLKPVLKDSNSFIYAADGSRLGSIPAERNRQPVPLDQISPWMGRSTVAIEDRRYYQHGGVDFVGIARAAVKDVQAGQPVEVFFDAVPEAAVRGRVARIVPQRLSGEELVASADDAERLNGYGRSADDDGVCEWTGELTEEARAT